VLNARRAAGHAERHPHRAGPGWGSGKVQGGERSVAHGARHLHPADQLSYRTAGTERLRISRQAPYHNDALVECSRPKPLVDVWARLGACAESAGQRRPSSLPACGDLKQDRRISSNRTKVIAWANEYIALAARFSRQRSPVNDDIAKARAALSAERWRCRDLNTAQHASNPWPNAQHSSPEQPNERIQAPAPRPCIRHAGSQTISTSGRPDRADLPCCRMSG